MNLRIGDQVNYDPDHGFVGVVVKVNRKTARLFVGRRSDNSPVFELHYLTRLTPTGEHYAVSPEMQAAGFNG